MSSPFKYALIVAFAVAIGIAGDLTALGQRGAKLALLGLIAVTHVEKLRRS